ncbi:MAG: tRNA lysidine(34) synthetase TilS [Pseudomonadota bacterium]|nr:tRNA lysidine(34) synthetase TilS [Pseudomonadota bacterium]
MPYLIHSALARFLVAHRSPAAQTVDARRVIIAFSGGLDSSVLLHAIATLPGIEHSAVHAVHIDHGLHERSRDWSAQCAEFAAKLSIPFQTVSVQVTGLAKFGPEGAARRARYAALTSILQSGDLLLTAHHADDQAETLLLRALRAAGLEGMAAMRPMRALGAAHLGRPLLDTPRHEILGYAQRHQLQWIEDPSNADLQLDRNFLRHQVLPLLESRWPQARRALADTARNLRAAESAARTELDRRVRTASGDASDRIRISDVQRYPDEEAATLIRHWLIGCNLPPPPPRVLDDLLTQLAQAHAERNVRVCWPGGELRRYRGELCAMRPQTHCIAIAAREWILPEELDIGDGRQLSIEGSTPPRRLSVRSRLGGESLCVAANRPRRELRLLFQEHGIPPWQRERLPYIFDGDRLIAVGSEFLDYEFDQWLHQHGANLAYRDSLTDAHLSIT